MQQHKKGILMKCNCEKEEQLRKREGRNPQRAGRVRV